MKEVEFSVHANDILQIYKNYFIKKIFKFNPDSKNKLDYVKMKC